MPILRTCKTCGIAFSVKPFHIKNGNGIFCSNTCHHESMKTGTRTTCFVCKETVYKTATQVRRSKSGAFFCGKSCQTVWRNKEFSGEKHKLWAGGGSTYRNILERTGAPAVCARCAVGDKRVLAVHHVDKNHSNNSPENLQWLCHNCHHRIHHAPESLSGST